MRLLFALLALANIGALMWGAWYREAATEQHTIRPDINAGQMRLLDEPGVSLEPRTQPALPPLSRTTPEPAGQCYRLTPGEDQPVLAKRLNELGIGYREHRTENREEVGQRVFLAGFKSQKAAEARRRQLARLGIKDHAIVQEPDNTISVALGVFSQADSMTRRLAELKKKGIKPRVETLYRTKPVFWIETVQIDEERIGQIARDMPGVTFATTPCKPEESGLVAKPAAP